MGFRRAIWALMDERGEDIKSRVEAREPVDSILAWLNSDGQRISKATLTKVIRSLGLKPSGFAAMSDAAKNARAEKVAIMAAMYSNGCTLEQIGKRFNVTRERVRQLLRKDTALTANDGGRNVTSARAKSQRQAKRDAACLARWGCTYSQHKELLRIGRQMRAEGCGPEQTPTRAWASQRQNAKRRGIGWELTLWDWWQIWHRSGKWEQRGRGQGYVMARVGDDGPYAIGNIYITTAIDNCSHAPRKKKSDLPTGVAYIQRGNWRRYVARRVYNGKSYHLGSFPTAEQASAAYKSFVPPEQVAA